MATRNLTHGSLQIKDGAGSPNTLNVPVMDGNLSFTEKRDANVILNRGVLYEYTRGPETACAISFDITFERWKGIGSSGNPSVRDALKGEGEAATWTSTNQNLLNSPFTTTLIFTLADVQGVGLSGHNEILTFTKFVANEINFKEGADANKITVSGTALLTAPASTSVASA